ncbi:MAG: ArnT family glycosyltransferase [Gammaproteobacteria bacterium]
MLALAGTSIDVGTTTLPLDGHEVLVARTAQEMYLRGDWIVPYFNGEPRLTKPPLSYWLTALVAWFDASRSHIRPWHARMPSMLAAFGVIGVTLWLGRLLADRATALLAGWIVAGSAGLFIFGRDARPDLLYAFWCSLGYGAFVAAWQGLEQGRSQPGYSYLMWCSYALATLTKGPQIPAMALLGCALFCWHQRLGWRAGLRLFRPLAGVAVFTAITVPWWFMLHQALGGAGLHGTQLSGTLLRPDPGRLFNFYYFYRPLQLVLPWALLWPATLWLFMHKTRAPGTVLLGLLVGVSAALLNLGPQQRWLYMLPLLPALGLLIAFGVQGLAAGQVPGFQSGWPRRLLGLHWLLIQSLLVWALWQTADTWTGGAGTLLIGVLPSLIFLLALRWRRWAGATPAIDVPAVAMMVVALLAPLSGTRLLWSSDRFDKPRLALLAREAAEGGGRIVSLGINPAVFVYYTGQNILAYDSPQAFRRGIGAAGPAPVIAILLTRHVTALPPTVHGEVLGSMPGDADEATTVLRLTRVGPS